LTGQKYFPKVDLRPLIAAAFAHTKAKHDRHWGLLDERVREYVDSGGMPKAAYCSYAALELGLSINSQETSNQVEQEMSRSIKAGIRHEDPLTALVRIAEQHARLFDAQKQVGKDLEVAGAVLMPYAQRHFEAAKKRASLGYVVDNTGGLDNVIVMFNAQEVYRKVVNLIAQPRATCTCKFSEAENMPCHHILAALRVVGAELNWTALERLQRVFHPQYFVAEYVLAYKGDTLRRPLLHEVVADDTLPPEAAPKRRGGSEKK
jgi:SWIM zinc finger